MSGAAAAPAAGAAPSESAPPASTRTSDDRGPTPRPATHPGKHNFLIWRVLFELDLRYTPIKPLGKGAYGVVCSASDSVSNERVAVKKIGNAFENATDARRTLREIQLLRHLRHDNVVALHDVLRPPSLAEFNDVYLVYELMDTDLHQIIRSPQPLTDEHCQYFVYQVLRGLKYIHSANVLHRDLKPSNLLLNANCDLKICDFGLARTSSAEKGLLTEYVVTRWYRAPELLLSCEEYTGAIDMWSVGCILAEMLGRKPAFPGKDYIHQLKLILEVLGTQDEASLHFISSPKAKAWIQSLPHAPPASLTTLFPGASAAALDLLSAMLVFDPRRRISVDAALAHPYLASLHDPTLEPVAATPFVADGEEAELKEEQLKRKVFDEVMKYAAPGGAPEAAPC